jgi:GAF domain-containing protein
VRPFTDKQIEVVQNFAAQAVIAIENARLLNELRESLQQQTATADVLRVISSSPTNIQPVLDAILRTAGELCESEYAIFFRLEEDGKYHVVGSNKAEAEYVKYLSENPINVDRRSLIGRTSLERKPVHIPDCLADSEYTLHEYAQVGKHRTMLGVPLLRDGTPIGVIGLLRTSVKPYTDKQIELVTTFADQAVIAIENVRLFEAEQQRTRELSESLEQQTATSEVLQVISRSTFDLPSVLHTLVESAARLCEADIAVIVRPQGPHLEVLANYRLSQASIDVLTSTPIAGGRWTVSGRVLAEGRTVNVPDWRAEPGYTFSAVQEISGLRSGLGVPLIREGSPVGVMNLWRTQVRPFSDKQIELVTTFANQAVIAIENARLLNELRESLQQQTATADVLKVISRSTFELQTVLQTLAESAARLCEAEKATITRQKGAEFYRSESYGFSPEFMDYVKDMPVKRERGTAAGRALVEGKTIHIPDVQADPEYTFDAKKFDAYRTIIGVPMLRDGIPIGVMTLTRFEVRPFTERQIELVSTFADQAVIAIENARLLTELRESLQQQTATADVLKVISRSTFDLQTVLDTLVESAARLCEADTVLIGRPKGESFQFEASHGYAREYAELAAQPVGIDRGSCSGRALLERKIIHVLDALVDPEYTFPATLGGVAGSRTLLGVPLLREGSPIGVMTLGRKSVRPFAEKQIELAETFADQAVIAIENVRLLDELRTRTDQLAGSVQELQALGEVSQAVNSTLDLETVLSTIVGRAVQLSRTDAGAIYVFNEEQQEFRLHATYGMSETMIAAITDLRIGLGDSNIGPAAIQRKPIQVPDIRNQPASPANEIILREGYLSILIVPLLRPGHIVGTLVVRRIDTGRVLKIHHRVIANLR